MSDAADEFRYPEGMRKKENGHVSIDVFEKFYEPNLKNSFFVKDLFDYYVRFTQQINKSLKVSPAPLLLDFDCSDRKEAFRVFPNDNLGYGLIQTAYDTIIIELCNAIINSEIRVDDILLPLLFLLHHSLELGCKRDLEISEKTSRGKSHELQKLHSKVNKDYDLSIKEYSRPDEQYSSKKISEYMRSFGKMYRDNPLLLRFPKMKNGELLKDGLSLKDDTVISLLTRFCELSPCLNWAMDLYYCPDEIAKDEENYRKLVESQKPMGEYDDGIDLDDRAFCE